MTTDNESKRLAPRKSGIPASLPEVVTRGATFTTALRTGAFVLLLIFVAIAPFPYGAILPGGNVEIELFAFVIAAIAFISRPRDAELGALQIPLYSMAAIAALGVFQIQSLPSSLLQSLSPVSLQTHQAASQILQIYGRGRSLPMISIAPEETRGTILLTLAFAALLASAALLVRSRARRLQLVAVLFATSVGQVIVAALTNNESDRIHGPFVNPNHFAGYLEIALPFAFATIWTELLNRERGAGTRDHGERLEKRAVPLLLRVLLWGVIATGIALTRSRGGIVAGGFVTVVMLVMATLKRTRGRRRRLLAAAGPAVAVAAGLAFVAFTTGSAPLLRFLSSDARDIDTGERVAIWRTSVQAWHLFPNLGSGLGAFREAFRRSQPADLPGLVEQAHNDFLQLLVTGGWVGATLGAIVFLSMLTLLARRWLRQRHRAESAFILAGFAAILSLTIHGLVDFSMSLPAIPATLAVMAGASWSASAGER